MLYVTKKFDKIVNAVIPEGSNEIDFGATAELLGAADKSEIFNFGTMLIPFIVSFFCILGIVIASRWPKNFSHKEVARELKKQDPTLDISAIEAEPDEFEIEEKGEIIFVQLGLWVLSGSLFGLIWTAFLGKTLKEFKAGYKNILAWIISAFIPFAAIYFNLKAHKIMQEKADELGIKIRNYKIAYIVTGIILPLSFLNFIGLALMQSNANKIYRAMARTESKVEVNS